MKSEEKASGEYPDLKVRGLIYGAVSRWTAEEFGEEKLEAFLKKLPDESKEILRNYDKKEWYPAKDAYVIYERLVSFLSSKMSEADVISGLVNFMFSQAVTGFMKGLMSFLTPARLTKRATKFWLRVHSQGRIEYIDGKNNQFNVVLHDWSVHRTSCLIFAGWLKQLVEYTGAKNVKVSEVNCSLDSPDPCRWEVKYIT